MKLKGRDQQLLTYKHTEDHMKAAKTQTFSANVPAQAFLPLTIHCPGLPMASKSLS